MDLWIFHIFIYKLICSNYFLIVMDPNDGEKPKKNKARGMRRKFMIIKNMNKGVEVLIKYNHDGIYIEESSVHLTSYLRVLALTMVPIRCKTWWNVPIQLKDKLWDSIEVILLDQIFSLH